MMSEDKGSKGIPVGISEISSKNETSVTVDELVTISTRVPRSMRKLLREKAVAMDCTVSDYVREILDEWLRVYLRETKRQEKEEKVL